MTWSIVLHLNAQLPRFNSRFAMPGSEAVDTFTVDWRGDNNWWSPLFIWSPDCCSSVP